MPHCGRSRRERRMTEKRRTKVLWVQQRHTNSYTHTCAPELKHTHTKETTVTHHLQPNYLNSSHHSHKWLQLSLRQIHLLILCQYEGNVTEAVWFMLLQIDISNSLSLVARIYRFNVTMTTGSPTKPLSPNQPILSLWLYPLWTCECECVKSINLIQFNLLKLN